MSEIFFSYAWGDKNEEGESREKIVDDLYQSLLQDGYQVVRDKYDLGYKGFISDFMARIGQGRNIIVAISKKYLHSPYCMFELFEIARNSDFDKYKFGEKVLPVMVEFVDFSKPAILEEYLGFWETEFRKWDDLIKSRSGSLSVEQFQRFDKIKMIYQNFGKLADWLIDMNSLNPALLSRNNFEEIKKAITENARVTEEGETLPVIPVEQKRNVTGKIKNRYLPVIAGALIIAAGIIYLILRPSPVKKDLQSVSVFVHGKKGRQDMILRKQGYVLMDVHGERKKSDINENGVAYFQNLQIGDSVSINVDFSEPYKSIKPDSLYIINADGRIYLPVVLQGIEKVMGKVLYDNEPLKDVTVTIDMLKADSDENGRFQINIPESEQKKQYTVWFSKPGFKTKSAPAFPQTGEELVVVMEK